MPRFAPPRSLYVHVPFCAARCGYCNFAIVVGRENLADDYLEAVKRELDPHGPIHPLDTVYFGGGTPTRLPREKLLDLCETILRFRPLADQHEWTVEANPGDLTSGLLESLASLGVTRISLGGQSLREEKLDALDRSHSPRDVAQAVELCRDRGLTVALDLIFAAPGETLDEWLEDLHLAIELSPTHFSTYGLTYEKGAAFWSLRKKGLLREVDEELQRVMYLTAIELLTDAGYEHYEVSNFALPGLRSRHNEVYWSGLPYDAVGPGAARYVNGVRETNHRSTTTYLKRMLAGESPVAEREQLSPWQSARERLVFGLRRLEGVELAGFAASTGYDPLQLSKSEIAKHTKLGLLEVADGRLRLTREGLLLSDAIWPDLL